MTAPPRARSRADTKDQPNPGSPRPRTLVALLAVAALLGGLLAALFGPAAMGLAGTSGDPGLASRVRQAIGDDRGYKSMSVAEVTPSGVTYAGLGVPDGAAEDITSTTRYPLGSITKTFNGMLLADAVQRGEVTADQRLETLLPELGGSEVGSVSLEELASHRAGVPPMLTSEALKSLTMKITLSDPYSADVATLLNEVRGYQLSKRGEVAYSNNGAALLGHALARAAHQPSWEALVTQRIFQPLGMTNTVIGDTVERVPADRVPEWTRNGHQIEPFTTQAHAPAGASTWTTAEDVAKYAQAILNKTAPGMSAVEPPWATADEDQIGLHWFTRDIDGHQITWHNGGTAGGRSILALDRDRGTAVAVLANSDRSVDAIGFELVSGKDFPIRSSLNIIGLLAIGLWLVFGAWFAWSVRHPSTKAGVLTRGIDAAAMAIFADRLGPWELIPGWVLGVGAGALVATAVVGALRTRHVPWVREKPTSTWIGLGASALVLALLAGLALFG